MVCTLKLIKQENLTVQSTTIFEYDVLISMIKFLISMIDFMEINSFQTVKRN